MFWIAPIPATLFVLVWFGRDLFRGSPDDYEGLTHALAPLIALLIFGFQFVLGLTAAAVALLLLRLMRG